MSIIFTDKELREIDAHLCIAASIYRDDAKQVREDKAPGWERIAHQFDKQEAECRLLMEKIGQYEIQKHQGAA